MHFSMNKKNSVAFNINKEVGDSDDIVVLRNKIQDHAYTLGFKKPQITVLATATSEAYRLFLNTFEKVNTTIYNIKETDSTGIAIQISGAYEGSNKNEFPSLKNVVGELDQKLEKVKNIFSYFDLSIRTNTIVLTLRLVIPEARETKFPKNS